MSHAHGKRSGTPASRQGSLSSRETENDSISSARSSVVLYRTGYVDDADSNGVPPTHKTVKYLNLGKLTHAKSRGKGWYDYKFEWDIMPGVTVNEGTCLFEPGHKPQLGKPYYDGVEWTPFVTKATMRSRTNALARDRVAEAAKRGGITTAMASGSSLEAQKMTSAIIRNLNNSSSSPSGSSSKSSGRYIGPITHLVMSNDGRDRIESVIVKTKKGKNLKIDPDQFVVQSILKSGMDVCKLRKRGLYYCRGVSSTSLERKIT